MARILEPLLWRVFQNTISGAGNLDTNDIDLDLTPTDAIQLEAVDFHMEQDVGNVVFDVGMVLIARPDAGNAVTTIVQAFEDPDTIAEFHRSQPVILTSGFSQGTWPANLRRVDMPGGLLLARRLTWLNDSSLANTRFTMRLWYRRVILADSEIVTMVSLRR